MTKFLGSMMIDASAILGAFCLVRGAWLIYNPSAYIVAGILLIAVSIIGARRWAA